MKRILELLLVGILLLTPCASHAQQEEVTLHVGKQLTVAAVSLPEGHNAEKDNYPLQYIKEKCNISIAYDWLLADQSQKVSLSLASGKMPDVMKVNYSDFRMLLESDMLADLTDAFQSVIPGSILEHSFALYPDALNMGRDDQGRLMAVPNQNARFTNGLLWIRQDWLRKLGLTMPGTLDELEAVARAFITQDPDGNGENDTIGLALSSKDMLTSEGFMGMLNVCGTLYNAFPGLWYRNGDGKVVYGSVESGTKDMLGTLARWYQEGLVDSQFAVRDNSELLVSGKCGITTGPWWAPNSKLGQSYLFDGADWQPILCPLDANGDYHASWGIPAGEFIVVSKQCPHPEAVFQALVASYEFHWNQNLSEEWAGRRKEYAVLGTDWALMPFAIVLNQGVPAKDRHDAFASYIDDGVYPDTAAKEIQDYLAEYIVFEKDPAHLQGWAWYKGMYHAYGLNLQDNIVRVTPCFSGITPTMRDIWTTLKTMEDETFLKIVLGTSPLDSFDTFVKQWHALGGDTILNEVETISR